MKKTNLFLIIFIALSGFACNMMKPENKPAENKPAENKSNSNAESNKNTNANSASTGETNAPSKDISGDYKVKGMNEGGAGNYDGDLKVQKRGDVYQFSWDTAGKLYDGVGVQTGSSVAVAFAEGKDGTGCGVILYQINSDGSLNGKAGYWGQNKGETEKATRTGGTDLVGEYDVKGTNPGGKEYTGKLSVKSEGSGYTFSWTGNNKLEGFGIKQGNFVAVGIGGEKCGFVSYEVKSDGTMQGKWGGYGSTDVGTETAMRK